MEVGDLVTKKRRATNRKEWVGIILKKEESTRVGLHCEPELRYEILVRWLSKDNTPYHLPENDEMWWGAWSLELISESR